MTENEDFATINTSAGTSVLNIGCGFSQLQEITSAMDNATKEEAKLAIKAEEVNVDGMP